jgi:hypothetical protein
VKSLKYCPRQLVIFFTVVKFYNNVILRLLLYFFLPGAQLQRRLQPRLLATAMRLYLHAQGCQRWAKWEVAAKAPQLPL